MTDEEIKMLQALPKHWQSAILKQEIEQLQNRQPPPPQARCWTSLFLGNLQKLSRLKAMLAKVSE